jgi:endonuclease YncB( thermonuclease family)
MGRKTVSRIGAVLLVLLSTLPVGAAKLSARVLWILDGETIAALAPGNAQYQVRLADIDAPYLAQRYG